MGPQKQSHNPSYSHDLAGGNSELHSKSCGLQGWSLKTDSPTDSSEALAAISISQSSSSPSAFLQQKDTPNDQKTEQLHLHPIHSGQEERKEVNDWAEDILDASTTPGASTCEQSCLLASIEVDCGIESAHALAFEMADGAGSPGWAPRTSTRAIRPPSHAIESSQGSAAATQNHPIPVAQRPSSSTSSTSQRGRTAPSKAEPLGGSSVLRDQDRVNAQFRDARSGQRLNGVSNAEPIEKSAPVSMHPHEAHATPSDAILARHGPTPPAPGASTSTDKDGQSRKQNSACDACRNRKVRCNRAPGEERCAHCKSKGIECTTIYVQLATSGAKRPAKRSRAEGGDGVGDSAHMSEDSFQVVKYLLLRDFEYSNHVLGMSFPEQSRKRGPTTAAEMRLNNSTARLEFVSSLLETYFSTVHIRYPIIDPHEFLQRFHYQSPELGGPPTDPLTAVLLAWGAKFSSHPIIMADRQEAALEELSPLQRQKRHAAHGLTASSDAPERPTSRSSSDESGEYRRSIGRSRIAEELIVKAQEVLDRCKVHRIATMDNVKAALIVEALFWQQASETEEDDATLPAQLRARKRRGVFICNGTWVNSALTHMFDMKVHLQETVMRIEDESQRGQIAMTWWLGCMMDAHMSAFYRRKPMLSTDDYTTEPPTPPTSAPSTQAGPQPTAAESGFRIWLDSAMDQVEMMRSVYYALWTPCATREGISARKLEQLASMAYQWRSSHLKNVGAPDPDWPVHWKFVDAVTACSSDINYQIIWVLMWQAIDEFDIAELKAANVSAYRLVCHQHGSRTGIPSTVAEMELEQSKISGLRNAIYDEALKASLRCAHLAGMLCEFDYLQHEAGIMKYSLCEAGYCLTRFRRPEVQSIIKGLRQYGQAFEECYEQANELERLAHGYMHDGTFAMSSSHASSLTSPAFQRPHMGDNDFASSRMGSSYSLSQRQPTAAGKHEDWDAASFGGEGRMLSAGAKTSQGRRGPSGNLNEPYADHVPMPFDLAGSGSRGGGPSNHMLIASSGLGVPFLDGIDDGQGVGLRRSLVPGPSGPHSSFGSVQGKYTVPEQEPTFNGQQPYSSRLHLGMEDPNSRDYNPAGASGRIASTYRGQGAPTEPAQG